MVEFALGRDGLKAFGEFGEDCLEKEKVAGFDVGLEEGCGLCVG